MKIKNHLVLAAAASLIAAIYALPAGAADDELLLEAEGLAAVAMG